MNLIPISEVFGIAIQGEGAMAGLPTVFVRTGGCDFHCGFSTRERLDSQKPDGLFVCDTLYAVDKKRYGHTWRRLSPEQVFGEVEAVAHGKPLLVTLSGGNPAIHESLGELIAIGSRKGYEFACETQGTIAQPWFAQLRYLTLSPKPPSSRMPTDWKQFQNCIRAAEWDTEGKSYYDDPTDICFKVVVFDEKDYEYAKSLAERYRNEYDFYLSVGTPQEIPGDPTQGVHRLRDRIAERFEQIRAWMERDGWTQNVRLLPQLHTLIYGNQRGR